MNGKPHKLPRRLFKNGIHHTGAGASGDGPHDRQKAIFAEHLRNPTLPELTKMAPQDCLSANHRAGFPSWLPRPRTKEERAIIAAHIRLPGLEAAQAKIRDICAVQRYVYPAENAVSQTCATLFMAGDAHPPEYPHGVPIPEDLRHQMPPPDGRQIWLLKNAQQAPWLAGFDQRMCAIAMAECDYGSENSADRLPDLVVLAMDDDRVIGYARAIIHREIC